MWAASQARASAAAECEIESEVEPVQTRPHCINWARLLKRLCDVGTPHCTNCGGGEFNIMVAVLERPVIEWILTHLG